ncbi:hypothetical protein QJQ45_024324, partial [Haematococcus lacustris]
EMNWWPGHFRPEQPLLPLDWATREYISGKHGVLGCCEDQHQTHSSPRLFQAGVQQANQLLKAVSKRGISVTIEHACLH